MRAPAPAPFTGKARSARFEADAKIGRGYLELTGYWKPLKL